MLPKEHQIRAMLEIADKLPPQLTKKERAEAIADAQAFLRDAMKRQRPNLNAFLGRDKPHSIITAEIQSDVYTFRIRPYEG